MTTFEAKPSHKLMDRIDKKNALERVKAMPDLPSPSETARRIIRLTQALDVSLPALEQAIRLDPPFAAKLVRVANQGRKTNGGRPIVSIKDALMVLGLPSVRGMALAFSLMSDHQKGRCKSFHYTHFWLRSLALAQAFQTIATRQRLTPGDEAFTVGLLANIGELALATVFPEPYGKLLADFQRDPSLPLNVRQKEALGFDHWEFSADLLETWGLPEVYALPIALHQAKNEDLPLVGSRAHNLACGLAVAADIADLIVNPSLRTPEKISDFHRRGARISLTTNELLDIGQDVAQDWAVWVSELGLSSQPDMNFTWVLEAVNDSRVLTEAVTKGSDRFNVLVVDDERAPRLYLADVLTNAGYQVKTVENGRLALAEIRQQMPDLILTDWVMPEMDGLALIKAIRAEPCGDQPYLLVLTGLADEDHLVEAFDAGADDYVVKPVKPRVLIARLKAGGRILRLQRESTRHFHEMRELANELSESNRRLQTLAVTDELTGCPNRRYASERLQQEWASSARRDAKLSCLVVDLDWFKQINDVHGHERGDIVLKQIAQTLRAGVRVEDVVCRVGGDEFWVICPGVTAAAASACGERLRIAVAELNHQAGDKLCTISVGVAERTPEMELPSDLIEAADRALYQAKKDGRGRVQSA